MVSAKKTSVFLLFTFLLSGCGGPSQENSARDGKAQTVNLIGTTWTLEELEGKPAIAHTKATLTFLDGGRVAGNGSCNRYMGPVAINGETVHFGPLAGTKMMCDPTWSGQETIYLKNLEAAKKFALSDGKLLIYVNSSDESMRFRPATPEESK